MEFFIKFMVVFLLKIKMKIKSKKKLKKFLKILLTKFKKDVNITDVNETRTLATEQRKDKKQP